MAERNEIVIATDRLGYGESIKTDIKSKLKEGNTYEIIVSKISDTSERIETNNQTIAALITEGPHENQKDWTGDKLAIKANEIGIPLVIILECCQEIRAEIKNAGIKVVPERTIAEEFAEILVGN